MRKIQEETRINDKEASVPDFLSYCGGVSIIPFHQKAMYDDAKTIIRSSERNCDSAINVGWRASCPCSGFIIDIMDVKIVSISLLFYTDDVLKTKEIKRALKDTTSQGRQYSKNDSEGKIKNLFTKIEATHPDAIFIDLNKKNNRVHSSTIVFAAEALFESPTLILEKENKPARHKKRNAQNFLPIFEKSPKVYLLSQIILMSAAYFLNFSSLCLDVNHHLISILAFTFSILFLSFAFFLRIAKTGAKKTTDVAPFLLSNLFYGLFGSIIGLSLAILAFKKGPFNLWTLRSWQALSFISCLLFFEAVFFFSSCKKRAFESHQRSFSRKGRGKHQDWS